MLENLTTFFTLVVLKVRPQMLPKRLLSDILLVTYGTFYTIIQTVIEHVKSQFVFGVEVSSAVVTNKVLGQMNF
jgi:hypothetical protein